MTKQDPRQDELRPEAEPADVRERYEAPQVQSVKLSDEAAESLT